MCHLVIYWRGLLCGADVNAPPFIRHNGRTDTAIGQVRAFLSCPFFVWCGFSLSGHLWVRINNIWQIPVELSVLFVSKQILLKNLRSDWRYRIRSCWRAMRKISRARSGTITVIGLNIFYNQIGSVRLVFYIHCSDCQRVIALNLVRGWLFTSYTNMSRSDSTKMITLAKMSPIVVLK